MLLPTGCCCQPGVVTNWVLLSTGGKIVNAACVYDPSHKDDKDFWDLVKRNLDLRKSNGPKMILGDYNVTLNFSRDTNNYLTDPHKKARIKINQWIYNADFCDVYEEFHPGRSSYAWSFRQKYYERMVILM